jgi:hypothetical protein
LLAFFAFVISWARKTRFSSVHADVRASMRTEALPINAENTNFPSPQGDLIKEKRGNFVKYQARRRENDGIFQFFCRLA